MEGRAGARRRRGRPRLRHGGRASHRRLRRHAPEGAHRELARRPRLRRPHAHAFQCAGRGAPRRRHPDGPRDGRRQRRVRADRRRHGERRGRGGSRQSAPHAGLAAGASGRHAGRHGERLRGHAVPRSLRSRTRGRRYRQGRQHLRRQDGRDRGGSHRQRLRRRVAAQRLGVASVRRRGCAHAEDAGHRGRPSQRLPLRSPARARGGRRAYGQRPPPVVPARADTADDDHVYRPRRRHRRRDHRGDAAGLLRQEPRRRAGRAGERQLRLRRSRGVPHRERARHHPSARRHAGRQRHRRPHAHRHDRRRLRREDRCVWQGRPGRARRDRPGHAAHRRDDGGGTG